VNYDNSLVVTITVICYSWAPSSGDHLFTCGVIFWRPQELVYSVQIRLSVRCPKPLYGPDCVTI